MILGASIAGPMMAAHYASYAAIAAVAERCKTEAVARITRDAEFAARDLRVSLRPRAAGKA